MCFPGFPQLQTKWQIYGETVLSNRTDFRDNSLKDNSHFTKKYCHLTHCKRQNSDKVIWIGDTHFNLMQEKNVMLIKLPRPSQTQKEVKSQTQTF